MGFGRGPAREGGVVGYLGAAGETRVHRRHRGPSLPLQGRRGDPEARLRAGDLHARRRPGHRAEHPRRRSRAGSAPRRIGGVCRPPNRAVAAASRDLRHQRLVAQQRGDPCVGHAPPRAALRRGVRRPPRGVRVHVARGRLGGRRAGWRPVKRLKAQPETPGVASIVVVNYRGADDTCTALAALRDLHWPPDQLEVIVVDNASGDGSVERIAKEHPDVRVLTLDDNRGFAAGCNAGAQVATGQYIAFLNNDARPDPDWVSAAASMLDHDGSVACVASKVLDWEGELVDFVDAGLGFYGHGFKLHAGEPDSPPYDRQADVLFASGAAMVVRASTFREVGGFDERYFLFFEDVDLGWRYWLLGYRVRYVPASLTYHRHHRSVG